MVAFKHLKSKNPALKVVYGILNAITTFIGGLINLFINFGKWCYKSECANAYGCGGGWRYYSQ